MKLSGYFVIIWMALFFSCASDDNNNIVPVTDPVTTPKPGTISLEKFGSDIVVYYNPEFDVFSAYLPRTTDGEMLTLSFLRGSFPNILIDETGSTWSVFGVCTHGENQGKLLQRPDQMVGFWFAISSTFAEVTLLEDPQIREQLNFPGREGWAVDPSFVFVAAPRDGITAIDEPNFTFLPKPVDFDISFLEDNDRVAVIPDGEDLLVLPIPVMNWHEIVNMNDRPALGSYTYCPLTGTSVHVNQNLSLGRLGVSGFLFNNNLIMFDRNTESLWSQMSAFGIRGPLRGTSLEQLFVLEMNWKSVKTIASSMYVLDPGDFYGRPYDVHPYGDYDNNNNDITFSLTYNDSRLPAKERVLAILLKDGVVAIRPSDFLP